MDIRKGEIATKEKKGKPTKAGRAIQSDFCRDDALSETGDAFCIRCRKYLCSPCVKSHGKFLADHQLVYSTDMPNTDFAKSHLPCEEHSNYPVELYCEKHCSVFCNFC